MVTRSRELLRGLALAGGAVLVALVASEGVLRLVTPAPLSYAESLRQSLGEPGRLFPAGRSVRFDARGLYAGAGQVTLRISPRRLIEPDPAGPADFRVLFLGGSTTEALYVPEADRWVARLNGPPDVATHNAGVSGANSIDAWLHLRHLTDVGGLRFDLVVLTNTINDLVWVRRFAELGAVFEHEGYRDNLAAWLVEDARRTVPAVASGPTGWLGELRIADLARRAAVRLGRARGTSARAALRATRAEHRARYAGAPIALAECPERAAESERFRAAARGNLGALAREVEARGARLLVLSEASSFAAPAASFHEDLRLALPCGAAPLTDAAAAAYLAELNAIYLEEAAAAGAFTFDLAPRVPADGALFYDSAHFTAAGSRAVARLLAPELRRLRTAGRRSPSPAP